MSMYFDRDDFQKKLKIEGVQWLTAYWLANCMEYISILEDKVKALEQQKKG